MAVSDTTHTRDSEVVEPRRRRMPYQALFAIAVGLVLAAIVLAVFALRGTTNGPSTVPPVTTPTAVPPTDLPSSSPSPTPTSAQDKAASDAVTAFAAYMRARNVLGHSGGNKADLAAAVKLTTRDGTERKYLTGAYVKELRNAKLKAKGWSKVTTRVQAIELGDKPPRVDLTACIDQSAVTVTKDGKPFTPPKFLRYSASMNLVDGDWLVDRVENATADLNPGELTSCEP